LTFFGFVYTAGGSPVSGQPGFSLSGATKEIDMNEVAGKRFRRRKHKRK